MHNTISAKGRGLLLALALVLYTLVVILSTRDDVLHNMRLPLLRTKSHHAMGGHDIEPASEAVFNASTPRGSKILEQLHGGVALHNMPQEDRLRDALGRGIACGAEPATQIVMISTGWMDWQFEPRTGGDIHWLNSFALAAERLGHPTLLVPPSPDGSQWGEMALAREYIARYPGCTKVVMTDVHHMYIEWSDPHDPDPTKVPPGLLLCFDYFGDLWFPYAMHENDFPGWPDRIVTANPNPAVPGYFGVPLSIEAHFIAQKPVPRAHRVGGALSDDPYARPRVYVLGKETRYLAQAYSPAELKQVQDELDVELYIGMKEQDDSFGDELRELGIPNHGRHSPERFYEELARSSVLLGIGQPHISPTPYEALYLGVPFVNPILEWDPEDADDESKWRTQHPWVQEAAREHVFNAYRGSVESLKDAIRQALDDRFEGFVPYINTPEAVMERTAELLAIDWEAQAFVY